MMRNKIKEIYALEQLSGGDTCIHRLNPTAKLLATTIFIITVVSFGRYDFGRLIPYIFFPTVLIALAETPYLLLLKRFLLVLPFCFFVGISNVILDNSAAFTLSGMTVSYGMISFLTIILKTYLCVLAVLELVSATPFSDITNSMRVLKIPDIFIIVFEMTYRYIGVLFEEALSMYTAYSLRSAGKSAEVKGIKIKDMGGFAGQLLLRSFDRAGRIYNAMKCRGYCSTAFIKTKHKLKLCDAFFFSVVCFLCLIFRFNNINSFFTQVFGGVTVAQIA